MISDGFPHDINQPEAMRIYAARYGLRNEAETWVHIQNHRAQWEYFYDSLNWAYKAGARDASALLWRADA